MRKEDPGKRFSSQSDDNEADDTFIRRKIEEAVATLKVSLSGILEDMPGDSDDSLDTDAVNWVLRMKDRRGDMIVSHWRPWSINTWCGSSFGIGA